MLGDASPFKLALDDRVTHVVHHFGCAGEIRVGQCETSCQLDGVGFVRGSESDIRVSRENVCDSLLS